MDISLCIIISKYLTGFEVPELDVHCKVDCNAEQLIEQQSQQLWSLCLNF